MAVTIGHALPATNILSFSLRVYGMSARVKVMSVIYFLNVYSQTLFFLASGNKDRNRKVREGFVKDRKIN